MIEQMERELVADFCTGKVYRAESKQRPDLVGKEAGYIDNCGYYRVSVGGRKLLRSHVVFALYYGRFPAKYLDHINRIRTDDRIENLREADHCENMWNRTQKKGRSLPMGVNPHYGSFSARIMHQRKIIHLGTFKTPGEASAAYQAKRRELYGQFA